MEFIKEELRQRFAEFFRQFDHYTPGLFSCNKNLVDLDVNRDRWVYLSIKFLMGENEHEVVQFFRGLEEVIVEEGDVLHHLATLPVTVHRSNILKSLALQLTPPFVSVHVAKAIESSFMKQNGVLN